METRTASVEIVVRSDGVQLVRLCGKSWDDEPDANRIYEVISHLVKQIDRCVREAHFMKDLDHEKN